MRSLYNSVRFMFIFDIQSGEENRYIQHSVKVLNEMDIRGA